MYDAMPLRLLLFADPRSVASPRIVPALLRACRRRTDIEVVGLVDTSRETPGLTWLARTLSGRLARRAFNLRAPSIAIDRQPAWADYRLLARRYRVPLIAPRLDGVNAPSLVERIRAELRPDASISVMVPQVFRQPLLEACGAIANYHDGLLPAYRGVSATAWSLFRDDPHSGFAYHLMTANVDAGPVLLDGVVAVGADTSPADLEAAKAGLAAARANDLIDRLVHGDAGRAQVGDAGVHTRANTAAAQTIVDPSSQTWEELQLRLRAFELVEMELAGRCWKVTALRRVAGRSADSDLTFTTADGVKVAPARCSHMPVVLYRLLRGARRQLA
jgi:methionyl-tRNA formyltransferase